MLRDRPLLTWSPNGTDYDWSIAKYGRKAEILAALVQYVADTSAEGYVIVTYPKERKSDV